MLDSLKLATGRVEDKHGTRPTLEIVYFSDFGLDCSSALSTEFGDQLFARLAEETSDDGLWKAVWGELGRLAGLSGC